MLNVYVYAHVDTLYTYYLFYCVLLSYHLFVEVGQSMVHIRSQLKTNQAFFLGIHRGANDITNEAAEVEEDSRSLRRKPAKSVFDRKATI